MSAKPVYAKRQHQLSFEVLVQTARPTASGAIIQSASRHLLTHNVDLLRGTCDCERWRWNQLPCVHRRAAAQAIAETILEIRDNPREEVIQAAIKDISAGCPILCRRYLTWTPIVQTPAVIHVRYGYSARTNQGYIGLDNACTYGVGADAWGSFHQTHDRLSGRDRKACLICLEELQSEIKQKVA